MTFDQAREVLPGPTEKQKTKTENEHLTPQTPNCEYTLKKQALNCKFARSSLHEAWAAAAAGAATAVTTSGAEVLGGKGDEGYIIMGVSENRGPNIVP